MNSKAQIAEIIREEIEALCQTPRLSDEVCTESSISAESAEENHNTPLKGLCSMCDNHSCNLPGRSSGVWHCKYFI